MIVYSKRSNFTMSTDIVMIFGVGLIGDSVCRYLDFQGGYRKDILSFNWNNHKQTKKDTNAVYQFVCSVMFSIGREVNEFGNIAILWSAGKAGFNSIKVC